MPRHAHYVFDAYGTLFDVFSAINRLKAEVGPEADRLNQMLRTKQLEYTWTRTLSGRRKDFLHCTAAALDYASAVVGGIKPGVRERILDAFQTLDAYPEVPAALKRLKQSGARLAVLSNGTPAMLSSAVRSAGLDTILDDVISIEDAGAFKPHPKVYALYTARHGIEPGAVSFQSSNRWDVAGAKAFGFHCVWINRSGAPDEYADLAPDRVVASLDGLA